MPENLLNIGENGRFCTEGDEQMSPMRQILHVFAVAWIGVQGRLISVY